MKYLKTYESYSINEGIFGSIGKIFGNIFKKVKENINKTKGGQEVEAIYQKYINMITDQLSKQAGVELNIAASNASINGKPLVESKIYEAETEDAPEFSEEDAKLSVETLKKKKDLIDQIVNKLKISAIKEMNDILTKYGGSTKNPQLEIIINAKKNQFDLDVLNAKIVYLEKAGDKTLLQLITKERDDVAKKIEQDYKEFDNIKPIEYTIGDNVIYKRKDFDEERWKELTPEDKKSIDSGKIKVMIDNGMIDVKPINKIDKDIFTFLDKEDKPFEKNISDILMKVEDENKKPEDKPEDKQKELSNTLGEIKQDPNKINKILTYANFVKDDANKDKIEEIDKIIKGE